MPPTRPALAGCSAVRDRQVDGDPVAAEAALLMLLAIMEHYVEQDERGDEWRADCA